MDEYEPLDQTKSSDAAVEADAEVSDLCEYTGNKADEPEPSSHDAAEAENEGGPDTEPSTGNAVKEIAASEESEEMDEVGSDVPAKQSTDEAANGSKEVETSSSNAMQTTDKQYCNQQREEDVGVQQDTDCIDSSTIPSSLNRLILFDDSIISIRALDDGSNAKGSTNKRWASLKPVLVFSGPVTRTIHEKTMFWSSETYKKRTLAIFNVPACTYETGVILILRDPIDLEEVRRLKSASATEQNASLTTFYIAESVIDPMTCKLRLSQLTTPTSIPLDGSCPDSKPRNLKRSFFELLTPTGSIALSAVAEKDGSESINVNSIVETTKYEDAVSSALLSAHSLPEGLEDSRASVTHQIVLGTLHSYVISGNAKLLQKALANALDQQKSNDVDTEEVVKLDSTVVDSRDTNWKTALHYACERKHSQMVSLLINAGSNFMIPTMDGYTPLHICAQNLDDKCLSIILSATHPTRPE